MRPVLRPKPLTLSMSRINQHMVISVEMRECETNFPHSFFLPSRIFSHSFDPIQHTSDPIEHRFFPILSLFWWPPTTTFWVVTIFNYWNECYGNNIRSNTIIDTNFLHLIASAMNLLIKTNPGVRKQHQVAWCLRKLKWHKFCLQHPSFLWWALQMSLESFVALVHILEENFHVNSPQGDWLEEYIIPKLCLFGII